MLSTVSGVYDFKFGWGSSTMMAPANKVSWNYVCFCELLSSCDGLRNTIWNSVLQLSFIPAVEQLPADVTSSRPVASRATNVQSVSAVEDYPSAKVIIRRCKRCTDAATNWIHLSLLVASCKPACFWLQCFWPNFLAKFVGQCWYIYWFFNERVSVAPP